MKLRGANTGVLFFLISAASALAQSGNPGTVNFSRLENPSLDPYTNSPTTAQEQWFETYFTRMGVFSPYFDLKTAWYTNAQVYLDSYAIYVGSAVASQHPEWILHDQNGNPLYINWGCSNGTCPQYAGDFANPNFRAWWIAQMQQTQSQGNYRGMWIDDVNMNFDVSDGNGNFVAPIDDSTGQPMTWTAWRNYFAQFLAQIRQAFPNKEILHNAPWFSGPDGIRDADPSIQQEIAAADIINMERGFASDPGITGGTGEWSLYAQLAYIDRVHAAGRYVVLEDYNVEDEPTQLYSLAGYYLISSGYDYYGDTSTNPTNWWNGFMTNLGAPLGPRTYNNGVFQRIFSGGMVLVGEPGLTTQTINLPGTFTTIDGAVVTSVSLSAAQGIVLLGTAQNSTQNAAPALTLNTTTLRAATAGAFYSVGLNASGGSGSYTFSLSGAPAGLAISGTSIKGTLSANAAGTYNVLVTANDINTSASAQQTITLTVYPPLSITVNTLPLGAAGVSYLANLTGAGGSGSYSWSIVNQPADLAISGNTLSGTPATTGVASGVIVTMMDTVTALSVQQTFSITVGNFPAVTTSSLPSGLTGSAYSATLAASGGSGNYSWSATGLPAGTGISGSNISGTPTAAGSFSATVTVTDTTSGLTGQKIFPITIYTPPSIGTSTLSFGVIGTAYSVALSASGGSGNYSWSATGLPAGLTLTGNTIAGTPTAAGTFSAAVTVTDSTTGATAQKTFSIAIYSALVVTTSSLPSGTIAAAYSAALSASGGSGNYSWSATGLPTGLTLTGSTIAGTPSAAGTFSAAVTVTDSTTGLTAQKTFSTTIYSALTLTTSSLPPGAVATAYSAVLSAAGGSGTYSWSATGLPTGLTLTGSTIAGTPSASGTFSAAVTVTDSTTGLTAQKTFSVTIYSALSVTTSSLPSGAVGTAYSAGLAASGGSGNYSWSATGLPAGLNLTGNTISGTPSASGTFSAAITVKDSTTGLTAQKTVSTTIYSALALTTSSLPPGVVGAAYSASLAATGGSGNYAWSATGLPAGLTLTGSTISGAPSSAGAYSSVAITLKDTTTGLAAQKTFSITIETVLAIATSSLPSCTVGTAYSAALAATGGSGNYSWSAAALPAGLSVSGSSIAGTPTAAGAFSPVVTLTDTSTGATAQKTFSLSCAASAAGTWVTLTTSQIAGRPAMLKTSTGTLQTVVLNGSSLAGFAQNSAYAWQPEANLGGYLTSNPAVAVSDNAGVAAFARGGDNAIWTVSQKSTGGAFGSWSSLGGEVSGDPFVLRSATGALTLFALTSNQTVWETTQAAPGGAWSAQPSLGGSIAGKPVAITNSDGTVEVFARGTDNTLWHNRQSSSGGAWGGWSSLGGAMTGDPAVALDPDGQVQVFILGTNNTVWSIAQTSDASRKWTSWTNLSGYALSNPATAVDSDGRIEIYVAGADNALWYRAQTSAGATTWTAWTSLGGNVADAVSAVANGSGTISVVARGTDNLPRARTQTAPGTW